MPSHASIVTISRQTLAVICLPVSMCCTNFERSVFRLLEAQAGDRDSAFFRWEKNGNRKKNYKHHITCEKWNFFFCLSFHKIFCKSWYYGNIYGFTIQKKAELVESILFYLMRFFRVALSHRLQSHDLLPQFVCCMMLRLRWQNCIFSLSFSLTQTYLSSWMW